MKKRKKKREKKFQMSISDRGRLRATVQGRRDSVCQETRERKREKMKEKNEMRKNFKGRGQNAIDEEEKRSKPQKK